jgi:N-ethylmaleimide reductase
MTSVEPARLADREQGRAAMATAILFEPLQLGALSLPNRIVMPALTRKRAGPGGVPTAPNAEYYDQRAAAGLNITDAAAISV